ncbi:hypothetical protein [Saccharopolyspora phatthalungensis]|uniref:Uncharacterized protein n=1 Tax=Saccharopolyspora phatthalungensis TaxID=664693 RepID=A0A840QKP6_9PSEU|nr:hypothetical protein [Saccharopolyspora phatthalungensis]MBB5159163.1 hypothetical protein [Saccharopolyspora phatthalungensis]
MLRNYDADPATSEFNRLPADADEQTRHALAERLAPYARGLLTKYPELHDVSADAPRGAHFTAHTIGAAINDLYNPAQIDVLHRVGHLLRTRLRPDRT